MTEAAREILQVNLEDEMRQSYLDYAMSVIVGRALPDVRDSASTRDPDPDMQFNSIFLEDASSPPDGAATGGAGGVPVEGNYRFRLNDRITITPAVIFLPQEETDDVVIGTIRTRFRF